MPIVLVLVFCLAAGDNGCAPGEPVQVQIPDVEMSACLGTAEPQERAGRWLDEHPGYKLVGWKCRAGIRQGV